MVCVHIKGVGLRFETWENLAKSGVGSGSIPDTPVTLELPSSPPSGCPFLTGSARGMGGPEQWGDSWF